MPIVSEPLGRVLGNRYRLVAALGSGASAHVFLAEDTVLQRRVAVKVLQPALAHDESFLRRFRAEARSVAAMNNPHVLRVFDWGEDADGPYLVLEYLEGGSLHDMLARGRRLSIAQAARTGAQAADGLAYAHSRGLVHRDVKPANLLFDEEGRVRVADFGVARALARSSLTEPSGGMVGTARYAAPEQAQGQPLGGRTDVYSLALVLCEAVTGSVPFVRASPLETLQARIGAPLPDDELLGPLWPLLARAADPVAEGRPDAPTFAKELEKLAEQLPPGDPLPLVRRTPIDAASLGPSGEVHAADSTATTQMERNAAPADLTLVGAAAALGRSAAGAPSRATLHAPGSAAPPDSGEPTANLPVAARPPGPRVARHRRRRHPWPWVAAALVILAAILVGGGLYAWQSELFVPTRRVPTVVGDPLATARQTLASEHFVVRVGAAVKSTTVPAGRVVHETPRRGTHLKQGSAVTITPSAGPPAVTVPSLTGQITCTVAKRLLTERHLRAKCPAHSAYTSTVPAGDVISWSYRGKANPTAAPYGATITVTVSQGRPPVTIQALAGRSWTYAEGTLAAEGLHPREALASSTLVGAGDVIATTPAGGKSVPYGSTVTVTVSKGPQSAVVPTVLGDSVAKATAAIQAAGLTVGPVYGPPTGQVFTTGPLKGQRVKTGSAVAVYTEEPPTTVTVPNGVLVPTVIGDTVAKATAAIRAAGLAVGPVYGPPAGQVFTTDPLKGRRVKGGSAVTIYTATPRTTTKTSAGG